MAYQLKFLPSARKEWQKLDPPIQRQFKKKLQERLINPHHPPDQLSGFKNTYKIKLRAAGYRLVYEVLDDEVFILVLAIGKRNKNLVYQKAASRNH